MERIEAILDCISPLPDRVTIKEVCDNVKNYSIVVFLLTIQVRLGLELALNYNSLRMLVVAILVPSAIFTSGLIVLNVVQLIKMLLEIQDSIVECFDMAKDKDIVGRAMVGFGVSVLMLIFITGWEISGRLTLLPILTTN